MANLQQADRENRSALYSLQRLISYTSDLIKPVFDELVDNTVYLLASLVEEYLKGFAKPAAGLSNGEGCVEKFYVSARKFVVPAKVNIRLENIGYSAWIPFGTSATFPPYEAAKEEITKAIEKFRFTRTQTSIQA